MTDERTRALSDRVGAPPEKTEPPSASAPAIPEESGRKGAAALTEEFEKYAEPTEWDNPVPTRRATRFYLNALVVAAVVAVWVCGKLSGAGGGR
jgi:hypothetical protein